MAIKTFSEENKNAIIAAINKYCLENGKSPTQREISKATGFSLGMVNQYMNHMRNESILKYSSGDVSTKFTEKLNSNRIAIPEYTSISCGEPKEEEAISKPESICYFPKQLVGRGDFFILTADGDSMVDIGIDDGDKVIIRRTNDYRNGDVVAVQVHGKTVLKRIFNLEHCACIVAENKTYEDEERYRYIRDFEVLGTLEMILKFGYEPKSIDDFDIKEPKNLADCYS